MAVEEEIRAGLRFGFGDNWMRFLDVVDERRIQAAQISLMTMLNCDVLGGLTFLDIGCGSGLFSLAARRLGARVHSFDFDPQSVACARELKRRFLPYDEGWQIEEGSILDRNYVRTLGCFDIVYSWGVLHHTGAMWLAIENAVSRVKQDDGRLLIAIYNDQGWKSHAWWFVKRFYNRRSGLSRRVFASAISAAADVIAGLKRASSVAQEGAVNSRRIEPRVRGMSAKYDWRDWIGGFPYEFALLTTVESYLQARGFSVERAKSTVGWGCNEVLARRCAV